MRLLITGDWHIRLKNPKYRTDPDYFGTIMGKIQWIFDTAIDQSCSVIIQPGDFFDYHNVPDKLKAYMIDEFRYQALRKLPISLLCVYGQHDLRFHQSDKENTPLKVLQSANVITILKDSPIHIDMDMEVVFYGASWGEEIPTIVEHGKDKYNILVTHRMVLCDEKIWYKQEDFSWGNHLLRETKFDLIVTGDNHQSFHISKGSRILINCGSLMRTNIDQQDHHPCVYIVDTENFTAEKLLIPVKPFDEVMNKVEAEKKKERDEKLESFVKMLGDAVKSGSGLKATSLNFQTYLQQMMETLNKKGKLSDGAVDIIKEVVGNVG